MATTTERPAIDPLDYLAIDALLDDEERAIRDTVRDFVRANVLDEVGDWFEKGTFPRELIAELGTLGLLGMHLDGYGLPGASSVAYGLTCMELEAGDAGVRSAVSVQGSLAMFPIWKWGSEEQKERWLPPMHTGEVVGCFGLTEPDAGSDPGSDPASGSVRPKQPTTSPVCIGGSQRSFCSSDPHFQIGNIASDPCTDTALRTPASPASSSRHVSP